MAPGKTRKEGTRTAQRGGGAAAMSTKGGKDGRRQKPAAGGDERFAAMHSDPRFRRFPKAGGKVEIDSRFAGMFSDEAFAVAGGVDKRGRKVGKSKSREDMRRYYRLAGEEEEEALAARGGSRVKTGKAKGEKEGKKEGKEGEKEAKTGRVKKSGKRMEAGSREEEEDREEEVEEVAGTSSSSEEDEEEGVDGMDARAKELYLRARGLAGPDSSGSSSSDDSEGGGGEESENEDEDEEELDIGDDPDSEEDPEVQLEKMKEHFGIGAVAALEANEQDITLVEDATRRIAVVDLDWRHVRAVDILSILQSFASGSSGRVRRVTVYPSDYGLERMQAEARAGPQGIYKEGVGREEAEEAEEEDSEGGEIDRERLRAYERSRLRYYYAVAEFDSAAVASRVYEECDGLEFEHSSCKLDLRFIPDNMDLSDRQVRDSADSVPAGYVAPMFQTKALKHTSVQLTWDADDVARKKTLSRAMTEDDVKEDDLRAFLASDDSSEGEDGDGEGGEALRERYRSLLGLGGDAGGADGRRPKQKDWRTKGDKGDGEEGSDGEDDADDNEDADDSEGRFRSKDADTGMEMEVTFKPSLEELGSRLMARKKEARKGGETVWEAYMRKKKERNAAKRAGRKHMDSDDEGDEDAVDSDIDDGLYTSGAAAGEADPFFQQEEDPFADPFFADGSEPGASGAAKGGKPEKQAKRKEKTGSKKSAKGDADGGEERDKAELELLLMDDDAVLGATRGLSVPGLSGAKGDSAREDGAHKLSRKERIRKKAAAKKARAQQYDSDDDEALGASAGRAGEAAFQTDLGDDRFKALYSDPRFALDPTDPNFQRQKGTADFAKEVSKRRRAGSGATAPAAPATSGAEPNGAPAGADMRSMVASLKRKVAKKKAGQEKKRDKRPKF